MMKKAKSQLIRDFTQQHGKVFCLTPFTEISITATGYAKLCCFSGVVDDVSYLDGNMYDTFHNSQVLNKIRNDILDNKPVKQCQYCYKKEQSGSISHRIKNTNRILREEPNFATMQNGNIKGTKILSFDIKFGNKCNLACVMCDSGSSSLWSKEIEKTPLPNQVLKYFDSPRPKYFEFSEEKMDELLTLSSTITKMKSTGGEPMLLDGYAKFIKKLVEKGYSKNIDFITVTNGTVDCTDLLPYMNEFKSFSLRWSVDGTGKVYDYVRWPSNFSKIKKTHKKVIDAIKKNNYTNIKIAIDPATHLLNAHNMIDVLDYANSLEIVDEMSWGYVYDPHYLNPSLLPKRITEKVVNDLERYNKNIFSAQQLTNQLKKPPLLIDKPKVIKATWAMLDYWKLTRKMDANDYIDTIPEIRREYS